MMPKSALLVEDNIDDQFLARLVLRKAGIEEISIATDGLKALEMLNSIETPLPELLILDLRMPKVSGLNVLTELRRQERTAALPVIILTSSEDPKDRESCLSLNIQAYLSKPLDLEEFKQIFS